MDVKDKECSVIEFLLLEGFSSDEIITRFEEVSGEDAYSRASVFRWIREVRQGNQELRDEGTPGRPCRYETDEAIRAIPFNELTASLRTIAETLSISPETVLTHLSRIGDTMKALRWILHTATSELK
jgi:transposase